MPSYVHLIILMTVGIPLLCVRPPQRLPFLIVAGALAFLPFPAAWLLGSRAAIATGTEGVTEAITSGILLALVAQSIRHRWPVIAVAACLFFLEEVDYGQLYLGYATPDWILALGSRSDRSNLHNLPALDWAWRLLPVLGVVVLSRRPLRFEWAERLLTRVRLPRLHHHTWIGLAVAYAGAGLSMLWVGERAGDEALELSLVAVTFCALPWDSEKRRS